MNVKSLVTNALTEAQFIAKIMKALVELGKLLFKRTKGNVAAAEAEIRRIPDFWADTDTKRAAVDAELNKLEREGK